MVLTLCVVVIRCKSRTIIPTAEQKRAESLPFLPFFLTVVNGIDSGQAAVNVCMKTVEQLLTMKIQRPQKSPKITTMYIGDNYLLKSLEADGLTQSVHGKKPVRRRWCRGLVCFR